MAHHRGSPVQIVSRILCPTCTLIIELSDAGVDVTEHGGTFTGFNALSDDDAYNLNLPCHLLKVDKASLFQLQNSAMLSLQQVCWSTTLSDCLAVLRGRRVLMALIST